MPRVGWGRCARPENRTVKKIKKIATGPLQACRFGQPRCSLEARPMGYGCAENRVQKARSFIILCYAQGSMRALELRRQNTLKPCSARPAIDLAGGRGCSERFKYVNVLMCQGDGSAGVDCGSEPGLQEPWVPPWRGLRPETGPPLAPAQTLQVCFLSKKQATTAVSGGARGGTRSSIGSKLGVWASAATRSSRPFWACRLQFVLKYQLYHHIKLHRGLLHNVPYLQRF